MKLFVAILASAIITASSGIAAERARSLTDKEARALIASAKTPEDHLRLAHYYESMAVKYATESKEHAEMAETYSKWPTASEIKRPRAADTVTHCRSLSADLENAAREAKSLATLHEEIAKN